MPKMQFRSAVKPAFAAVLLLTAGAARAQTGSVTLYHVDTTTYGCGSPEAIHALANPQEPRRNDPAWVKNIYTTGHCVTITPKSPWKLLSQQGDLSFMSYAGTIGPPGSYYLVSSTLLDPTGHHPGDTVADPNAVAPTAADSASATALAPPADNNMAAGPEGSSVDWVVWLPAILIVIAIAGFLTWLALERRKRVSAAQEAAALALAIGEIRKLSPKLHVRRIELTTPDHYGTVDPAKWESEKEMLFRTRIAPLLEANGYGNAVSSVKPAVMTEFDKWTSEIQPQPNSE